jgi:UDP-N-acetylglucosamine transferase subunit ALG13
LVVINETLMGNHQRELAEAMAARGYLHWVAATQRKVVDGLLGLPEELEKLPVSDRPLKLVTDVLLEESPG